MSKPTDNRDKARSFRVPDAEWEQALAVAESRGESLSAVLRRTVSQYARVGMCDVEDTGEHVWVRNGTGALVFDVWCSSCGAKARATVSV